MTYSITDPLFSKVFTHASDINVFYESLHLKAYPDPGTGGEPYTIGFGTTVYEDGVKVQSHHKISKDYAHQLLAVTLLRGWARLEKAIPGWHTLEPMQQAALLSFGYNNGYGFYGATGFKTITDTLKNFQYQHMEKVLQMYRNPDTNVELGLWRRRISEVIMWNSNSNWAEAKKFSMEECQAFNFDYWACEKGYGVMPRNGSL